PLRGRRGQVLLRGEKQVRGRLFGSRADSGPGAAKHDRARRGGGDGAGGGAVLSARPAHTHRCIGRSAPESRNRVVTKETFPHSYRAMAADIIQLGFQEGDQEWKCSDRRRRERPPLFSQSSPAFLRRIRRSAEGSGGGRSSASAFTPI